MINQVQKFRYLFPEIFKEEKKLASLKIGFVTEFIKNKFQQLSFLYGLSLYAKVEQLFVRFQKEEIQDIFNYFKNVQSQQMIPDEHKQIETVCQWLNKMISFLQSEQAKTLEQYIQFYNQVFYQDVFVEFANRKDQYLVEECLSFASSLYIQWWAVENQNKQTDLVNECLKYLQCDQQDYLKLNDEMKIVHLANVYNITIRFYLDFEDTIDTYHKKKSQISEKEKRFRDLSLNLIYNVATDSFRICYDQNYKSLFQQYQYFSKIQRYTDKEVNNYQQIFLKVKQAAVQEKNSKLQDLQSEISNLEEQCKQEKQETINGVQQYQSMKNQETNLENEIQNLLNTRAELNQQLIYIKQKQNFDFILQKQQEEQMMQNMKQALENQIDQQLKQIKSQSLIHLVQGQIDIEASLRPLKRNNVEFDLQTTISQKRKFYCEICTNVGDFSKQIYFSCCQKRCCRDCVVYHFENTQMIHDKKKLVCPFCSVQLENINQLYDLNIITDKVKKIFKLELNQCCNSECNKKFYVTNKNAATVKCPACNTEHCMGCFKNSHSKESPVCQEQIKNFQTAIELHIDQIQQQIQQKQAQQDANNDQVQKDIKELEREKRFRVCPICYNLLLKDAHCEHIKCNECKTELCFTCVCLRIPTTQHDNQFHRRECPYSDKRIPGNIKFEKNCSECNKNQKVCEVPPDFSEYLQQIVIAKFGNEFYQKYPQNWVL
ncbi:hypothetical protein ABPG72_007155 [Tetrahymena utriculariae]